MDVITDPRVGGKFKQEFVFYKGSLQLYLKSMKSLGKVVVFIFATLALNAQELRFGLRPIQYVSESKGPYVDFYSTLDASTVAFEKGADSLWHARFKVAISFEGKIDVVLFELSSEDSASSAPLMLQKSTFTLEAENALLKRPLEVYLYDEVISRDWTFRDTLELPNEDFWLAQPILLNNVTEVPANYVKRGLPIVPVASLGVPVFENEEVLSIYAEAFIGNGKYILQYKLTDSFGNLIPGTSGYMRCNQGSTPLYNKLNFASQKSGQYEFNVVMLDSTGTAVMERSSPFYWYNDKVDNSAWDGPEASISRVMFEKGWGYWNKVNEYLRMIAPVASFSERRILSNLKDSDDTARIAQFIVNFWREKNPSDPLGEWKGYQTVVQKVDQEFGTRTVRGYRTQMGRVFLQYGAPSLVEERPFDGRNYPYQVWQYDQLISSSTPVQQNQIFIFVDQELIGRQYTLIHSSALGEVKDHKWQYHLTRHTNTGADIDATSTQYSRDNFGERISNSIIIGNQGTWFDRFNY